MKPTNVLVNAVLAAVVAAATAAGTSYLFLRYAPMGPQSADPVRIERIIRDYLFNKPEILVEMTNELDKRQATEQSVQQQKAISQNADAIFRSPVSRVAGSGGRKMNLIGQIAAFLQGAFSIPALAETIHGTLYKDQHCECCEAHAEYLSKNGFDLKIEAVKNLAEMSVASGVPQGFQGCHIIKINGYVFEGHITSDIIKRFLAEHPQDVAGLSIPGMPSGVPGMEGPRDSSLVVYAINKDGSTKAYATQ